MDLVNWAMKLKECKSWITVFDTVFEIVLDGCGPHMFPGLGGVGAKDRTLQSS